LSVLRGHAPREILQADLDFGIRLLRAAGHLAGRSSSSGVGIVVLLADVQARQARDQFADRLQMRQQVVELDDQRQEIVARQFGLPRSAFKSSSKACARLSIDDRPSDAASP
jgi:hypothetical protein